MLSQLRGHNRRGEEEQLKKWREKKDRSQEGRREKKLGESRNRVRPFNLYCLCSCLQWQYSTWKVLLLSFYLNRKPPLVHSLWRSLLSTSRLQPLPQGLLVSLLEGAAAWHFIALSVPGGKQISMTLSPFTRPPSQCHADYISQGASERENPKGS